MNYVSIVLMNSPFSILPDILSESPNMNIFVPPKTLFSSVSFSEWSSAGQECAFEHLVTLFGIIMILEFLCIYGLMRIP